MLVRQFISDIQTSIRSVTSDGFIPPRFIYSEAQAIIADFLKKDNDAKKKLTRVMNGWSTINCIDLEEVDVIECPDIDVRICGKLMKSTKRIPDSYTYSYGNIIKYVASPNLSYFFDPTNPRQWNNIQKQRYKDKNKYYYFIIDSYIYLPVPKGVDLPIENIRMEAYFMDKYEVDIFNNTAECGECTKEENCKSPLDYELVIAPYLVNDVKKELLNRLFNTYLKLSPDEYSNLNSSDKNNAKDIQTYQAP